MSSDLVTRLLRAGDSMTCPCKSLTTEAADELERLQQRVKWLEDYSAAQENEIARANRRSARHDDTCPSLKSIGPGPCSCGADDAGGKS